MTCEHEWANLHSEDSDAFCKLCNAVGVPCGECDGAGEIEVFHPEDRGDRFECPVCNGTGTAPYVDIFDDPIPTYARAELDAANSHSPFAKQRT